MNLRVEGVMLAVWACGVLAASGCSGSGTAPAVTTIDSAGIRIVTNTAADHPLSWPVDSVLTIRPSNGTTPGFLEVTDLAVVTGNRIVVLDRSSKAFFVYDGSGTYLGQHGREGSGPGEFQFPVSLAAQPGGGVAVFDIMNRRLERFDSTFAVEPPDLMQVPYFGGGLEYTGTRMVLSLRGPMEDGKPAWVLEAVSPEDTSKLVTLPQLVGKQIQIKSCGMGLSGIGPLFEPSLVWTPTPAGGLVVVHSDRYEIDVLAPGTLELTRRIRRKIPRIEATAEIAAASLGDGMKVVTSMGTRVCDPEEVVELRGFEKTIPPVAHLAVGPGGDIFVARWAPKGTPPTVDVLDPDGTYLGSLPAGTPEPEAFLGRDRFLARRADSLGVTSLVVYRIGRAP